VLQADPVARLDRPVTGNQAAGGARSQRAGGQRRAPGDDAIQDDRDPQRRPGQDEPGQGRMPQGIISATGRTVGAGDTGGKALITAAIQTSAAINPGNSGGALVDLNDQVVGIPTLAARLPNEGGAAPGIGFAIPANTVEHIADQLIKTGKVTDSGRASLGITGETTADSDGNPVGVAVVAVANGGTAASAGVRPGDIIVGLNGQRTNSLEELEGLLSELKPGAKVTVHYTGSNGGNTKEGTGKLGSLGS
jgi:S1-C subfamily serine protease